MYFKLFSFIKSNKYFWKFRHLFDSKLWDNYYKSYNSKRRFYYSDFCKKNNINSVFEFGCGSGPNLKNLQLNTNKVKLFIGYDISQAAINFAKKKIKDQKFFFISKLKKSWLVNKLHTFNLEFIDLAIYDRVLYLLSEKQIKLHLDAYSKFFNYIIIDDFHTSKKIEYKTKYQIRNFQEIMLKYNFAIIDKGSSLNSPIDNFFLKYAKRLVFKKINFS